MVPFSVSIINRLIIFITAPVTTCIGGTANGGNSGFGGYWRYRWKSWLE
jgi:hypothetical protein